MFFSSRRDEIIVECPEIASLSWFITRNIHSAGIGEEYLLNRTVSKGKKCIIKASVRH